MTERLLVVMPNWFGEVLFTTPLLRVVREAYPRAFIAALHVPRVQDVLTHNPCCNELLVYDEEGTPHIGKGSRRQVISELRDERFDTAIILRRSLSRTLLLVAAGIPRRIGFANWKSGWLLTDRVSTANLPAHKAYAYLRLLEPLGILETRGWCEYHVTEEERAQMQHVLQQHGMKPDLPVVVLHAGANWPHKRWPTVRLAQAADRLMGHRCQVVLTGSPEDVPLVEAIASQMITQPIRLDGQTTFRQMAACVEQADLVIANDTGVLHIAAALRRPLVGLYGPTDPSITGPIGDPEHVTVIHHSACCPAIPCRQPQHPGYPGMEAITVEEVTEAALSMLQSRFDLERFERPEIPDA